MTVKGNPHPHRYKNKREDTLTPEEFRLYFKNAMELDRDREMRRQFPQLPFEHLLKPIKTAGLLSTCHWAGLRISEVVGDRPRKYEVMFRPKLVGTYWVPDPNTKEKVLYPNQPEGFSPKRFPNGFVYKMTEERHGLRKQDMSTRQQYLIIDPKEVAKHGKRDEPLFLDRRLLGVDQIIQQWALAEDREDKVFPISKEHGWFLISMVTEGTLYPHYFRMNLATKFASHPDTSIIELQQWFGWRDPRTVQKYMGKAGRVTRKMGDRLSKLDKKKR